MKAKKFKLKDKDGKEWSLKDFDEDYLVLYFYPKDNTPGCTIEANEFERERPKFKRLGAKVVGISGGDEKSKKKFCEKHGLKILLLSDPEYEVSKKYRVYGKKKFMGREFNGIKRTTFILDKDRRIIKRFENVKPLGHAKEVLQYIKEVAKGKEKGKR